MKKSILLSLVISIGYLATTNCLQAQGCNLITYSVIKLEPCKYRLQANSETECYPFLRLLIDIGEFSNVEANLADGWTAELVSPMEILLTHESGFIPLGESTPVEFDLPFEIAPLITFLWDYDCPPGEGCVFEFQTEACTQPTCTSISFSFNHYEPCKYRLHTNSEAECFPFLNMLIDVGEFDNVVADVANGWTAELLSPMEILLTHDSGFIPIGESTPVEFTTSNDITPLVTFLWDNDCPPGEGCIYEIELESCMLPCQASFLIDQIDSCGHYEVISSGTGAQPLLYSWCNGSTTQNLDVILPCGPHTFCLTITDANGCTSEFTQTITVSDTVPPTALCILPIGITLDTNCEASITVAMINQGSFDDCQIQSMAVSPTMVSGCGIFPVTLTVTDWCGNTSTCQTEVQTIEDIPPVLICPPDLYLTTSGADCMMLVPGIHAIASADNCGTPILTYDITGASTYSGTGDASGLLFNVGTSIVTYTATDQCGNTSTCSFKVIVECICDCQNNMLQNSGFNQGSITGNLGSNAYPGHTNNWMRGTETPWVDGSAYCCDPFSIYFWAYRSGGESIYQQGVQFVAGRTYKISYCSKSNLRYGFQTTNSPVPGAYNPYNCSNCENIGISAQAINSSWATYTMPLWTATQNADVLFIRGLGSGSGYHNKGWIDNVCVQEILYSCCGDQKDFDENASHVVNIYVDQNEEEVTLSIGSLLECNRIAYVDWGDGSEIVMGPIDAHTILTHAYLDTNIYEIEYLIQEFDTEDTSNQVCFEKLFSETVQIAPDDCLCDAFSSMYIRSSLGAVSMPVTCGGSAFSLECPLSGSGFSFSGLFECMGTSCNDTSTISWRLTGPEVTQIGETSTRPYFSIDLPPTYFTQPGMYTLTLAGLCGNEFCECTITFNLDPPCDDPCPCNSSTILAFENTVQKEFPVTLSTNNCSVCITPPASSDCVSIDWYVDALDGFPEATTTGNQQFCYNFPGTGTYTVWHQSFLFNTVGEPCVDLLYSQSVTVTCSPWTDCDNTVIGNPDFSEGAMSGGFNSGGSSDGWNTITGEPVVIEGEEGSTDAWSIQLAGNRDTVSALTRSDAICLIKGIGRCSTTVKSSKSNSSERRFGGTLKVLLARGWAFPPTFSLDECDSLNCYELASIPLPESDSAEWYEIQIPFDLSGWEVVDDCGGIVVRPIVYVTNVLGSEQGGEATYSYAQLDKLCFNGMLVSTNDPLDHLQTVHVYPNPTAGEFTVQLSEEARQDMLIRIIGLTGQTILEKKMIAGDSRQTFDAYYLPNGMYFLQVFSEGRWLSVNKFVKN